MIVMVVIVVMIVIVIVINLTTIMIGLIGSMAQNLSKFHRSQYWTHWALEGCWATRGGGWNMR